jgi:hypothetical protein
MIVYISIGNSDDKLTQQEWSDFLIETDILLDPLGSPIIRRHGVWHSRPDDPWQNACWCVEIEDGDADELRDALRHQARQYRQDSVAFAVADTEFLEP